MVKDRVLVYFIRSFRYPQCKIANDSFDAMMVLSHFIYNTYLVFGRDVSPVQEAKQMCDLSNFRVYKV